MRLRSIVVKLIGLAFLLVSCQAVPGEASAIEIGSSRAEVRAELGEPQRMQEFILPEAPFFGPQESLTGLVPPGATVEEWVYLQGEEEWYIWFTGPEGQNREAWQVVETGRYPVGAVY